MNIILALGLPSGPDLFVLFLIVLVLFGAKRLPELARGLGQGIKEFKKAKDEFDDELHKTTEEVKAPREAKDKQLHTGPSEAESEAAREKEFHRAD
jgi:sec-independent protein translocase protein TatA